MDILRTMKENGCNLAFRVAAALLVMGLFIVCVYASASSADVTVSFVNYDMQALHGAYPSGPFPDGAMLYTAADLEAVDGFQPTSGCTWYLYKEADDGQKAFGPVAIPDPPARVGYEFYDWASLNTTDSDGLHTVQGDTVFLARYARSGQYLISFYYQYDDETRSVAAPTTSTVGGLGDSVSMSLSELEALNGLTPQIRCLYEDETAAGVTEAKAAAAQLNTMLQNGVFSATINEEFLELCRTAWFVEWDMDTDNYKLDANGVVRINIPVVYKFDGTASFEVHYYLQDADNPQDYKAVEADFETAQISGNTHVSLEELGLVKEYEGFALNDVSRQYAASYTVNPNGSTVIDLRYDRDIYYVTYQLHGGNLQEPVAFRYGQMFPTGQDAANDLLATPVRSGYIFDKWTIKSSDGAVLPELPAAMPAYDLVLEANWKPSTTTVTITYWMENANDEDYTPVASRKIGVNTESNVGYEQIATYLEPEEMKTVGIMDGAYFSLVNDGDKAIPTVIAAGDGSTTINAYYDRKEYTLVFHIGKVAGSSYQISAGGNSSNKKDPDDWTTGYSAWKSGANDVQMTINNHVYKISNDTEACYQITDKYGAFIGDQWPVASEDTITKTVAAEDKKTYQLFTWGTHAKSPYFQKRENPSTNKNIMGVYSTMSAELIIDAARPDVYHHLTAYWAAVSGKGSGGDGNGEYKNHHYLFEAVPGAVDADTPLVYGNAYGNTSITAEHPSEMEDIASIQFYEYQKLQVRTTNTSKAQNPPAFANLTFQYGCYNGADVYFFYTYNDYTLTYDENNANLTSGSLESHRNVTFHYVGGMPLKDTLAVSDFVYNYKPEQPYVCQYGNNHLFAGWYKDPACTVRIDWDSVASESSVTAYAKWDFPTFDLTLEVPGGSLPDDVLRSIRDKGYTVETTADSRGCAYIIQDVTDGTPINQVLGQSQQPESNYGLVFQDWYETDEDGLAQRFLFDDSQVMNSDRTLTAQWVEQNTGVYAVRYLTTQDPHNGLGTVEVDGVAYYRLRQDDMVLGLAIGSTVTLEPRLISGYLPDHGSLTQMIIGSEDAPTLFNFVYAPLDNQAVTYTVHYVLDAGVNYGRTAADSSIPLAASNTFTLSAVRTRSTTGSITGTVRAMAALIPGYVPLNGYQAGMVLSSVSEENHLYFYYVANADAGTNLGLVGEDESAGVSCQVDYYLWDDAAGTYALQDFTTMKSTAGTILYAAPYAEQYLSQSDTPGLAMDYTHTALSVVVSEGGNNILPIYFKAAAGEDLPDTDWSRPKEDLPESQPGYVPILPPAPEPDTGNGDTGDGDTGDSGNVGGGSTGPVYYTLRYESNGGTGYPTEQYAANDVVVLDKTPLRAGCRFTGWYIDAALTQPVTTITMTANCTVYAGWMPSAVPDMLNGTDHFAYIVGYADGAVRPVADITRAEVAAIFFRLLDPEVRTVALTDQNPFTDVSETAWFNQAVSTMCALGIFQGRTETWFDGNAPITRAEFAAVCARFDHSGAAAAHNFTDIESHWAREEIGCAAALGWILGYEDGTFRPDQPITRAEAMSMVNRVLHRLPETAEDLLPDMTVWPDNLPDAWYYLDVQEATNTHTYILKGDVYETWTGLLDTPDWTEYQ